jgi:dienelactone hydrolase
MRSLLLYLVLVLACWAIHPADDGTMSMPTEVALACCETAPSGPGPVGEPTGIWREQIHWVETHDAEGDVAMLYTRICRPPGDVPGPVVVIAHGTPRSAAARARREPISCDAETARWFLDRGYVVVAGMRRGYGASTGAYVENAKPCSAADFVRSAREASRDIDSFVEYAARLPFARPDGMVVIGHSTGGLSTVAYDSFGHPRVNAMINMAGGRGAHVNRIPNKNCRPDQLVEATAVLGETASTPMLWVYAENDTYFEPSLARAMHYAFVRAGAVAQLVLLPPFGDEGHKLFFGRGGSAIWGPVVDRYLLARAGER